MKIRHLLSLPLLCALAACSPKLPTPGPPPILQRAARVQPPSLLAFQRIDQTVSLANRGNLSDSP